MRIAPVIAYPITQEREYEKLLHGVLVQLKTKVNSSLLHAPQFNSSYESYIRRDSIVDDLDNIITSIAAYLLIDISSYAFRLATIAASVGTQNLKSFLKAVKSAAILGESQDSLEDIKDILALWVSLNRDIISWLISSTSSEAKSSILSSLSKHDLKTERDRKILKVFEKKKMQIKSISATQINNLAAQMTRIRSLGAGFTEYKWITCRDDRVRLSHAVMEGKICTWNDDSLVKDDVKSKWKLRSSLRPAGVEKIPGEDYNCRCSAAIIIKI